MFKHIVLFKSKDKEAIKSICKHVMSLKQEIPGLLSIKYAENLTDNANGYNQMAIMLGVDFVRVGMEDMIHLFPHKDD